MKTVSIPREIRKLVPPATIEDTPAGQTKLLRYPGGAYDGTQAQLSAGVVPMSPQYLVSTRFGRSMFGQETLYRDQDPDEAADIFRAVAWVLGAPYPKSVRCGEGFPDLEVQHWPFDLMISISELCDMPGIEVRWCALDIQQTWGPRDHHLILSATLPLESTLAEQAAAERIVERLGKESYGHDFEDGRRSFVGGRTTPL